jgi:hypothetical protein
VAGIFTENRVKILFSLKFPDSCIKPHLHIQDRILYCKLKPYLKYAHFFHNFKGELENLRKRFLS